MANFFPFLPKREPGLISMMYWVTYSEHYKLAFHKDQGAGTDFFAIKPDEAADEVHKIGTQHEKDVAKELTKALFATYLVDEFLGIWAAANRPVELPPEHLPNGLVPFMYWVKHNSFFNAWLRSDAPGVTKHFGLNKEASQLIAEIGAHPDTPEAKEQSRALFALHLVKEVLRLTPKPVFW